MANPDRLTREQVARLIPLYEAATQLRSRRPGRPVHPTTLRKWIDPDLGCQPLGEGGPKIVLWTVVINNQILTLPEKVQEFEEARIAAGIRGGTSCPQTQLSPTA